LSAEATAPQARRVSRRGALILGLEGVDAFGHAIMHKPVGPDRRGAGSMPATRRISRTVDGATVTPSFVSSPWIRRYPHSGFSLASRTTRRGMLRTIGGRPGLRRLLVSYFLAASLRCQARSVAGVTGKISVQRLRGRSRADAANHTRLVPHTPSVTAQHRILVPEHQQLSFLRPVPAEHQDSQAEYLANQQVDDLERHSASQPSPRQACCR